jgi:hypothetical protein
MSLTFLSGDHNLSPFPTARPGLTVKTEAIYAGLKGQRQKLRSKAEPVLTLFPV